MSTTEFASFWVTVGLYAVGSMLAIAGAVFRKRRALVVAFTVCGAGLVAHVVAVAARVAYTGHLPVASRYENVLTGAAVVMLFGVVAILRRRELLGVLIFAAPFTLLMMGYAALSQPSYTTMSLVLDNLWMFVHILFAWLAYGAYALATGTAVLHLLASRYEGRPEEEIPAIYRKAPAPPLLEDLVTRSVVFGLVSHVVMIASGAIWARDLWGSYWSWDPVETWSLLSWLVYASWIHVRLTLGWRGRRMSWLAVAALVTVLVAFWGTTLLGPTDHALDALSES